LLQSLCLVFSATGQQYFSLTTNQYQLPDICQQVVFFSRGKSAPDTNQLQTSRSNSYLW
jgi:hypothetical protein